MYIYIVYWIAFRKYQIGISENILKKKINEKVELTHAGMAFQNFPPIIGHIIKFWIFSWEVVEF